jgi:hypothetical protein
VSAPRRDLPRTALAVAPLVAIVAIAAVTAVHHLPRIVAFWAEALRWPYPTQGSESLIVWEAGKVARGESIYVANTPTSHGFVSGPYTPLYYVAVAATLKLTLTVYTGARLISLCAWLVLLGLVAALVLAAAPRRAGWFAAALAVVGLAVFSPGVIWAVRAKPTIPALALALIGLLIVQYTYRSPRHAYLWALLPFVAAYFTKQTELAAPAAAALFLLVHAGWRRAARFVAVGGLAGGVSFALLTLATGGEFFRHIIADRRLAWQSQLLLNFGGLFLRDSWPLLAAAIIAAIALALARVPSVAPYFLLAAGVLVVTIGVEGADHDHLIELATACAVALGCGLAVVITSQSRRALLSWVLLPLLVAQLVTGWTPDRWYDGELRVPDAATRRQLDLIITNIRNTPGDVLSEEIGLIILAGKPVPYDDPQAMAALSRVGRWDERQLLDDLNNQRFALVILPANPRDELWTPEVIAAIRANYDLKFRDVWFTWEAKRLR